MTKLILPTIVGLTLLLSSCAQLLKLEDKGDEEAARFVNQYCDSTDQAFRTKRREGVNAHAAPDSIAINCAPR